MIIDIETAEFPELQGSAVVIPDINFRRYEGETTPNKGVVIVRESAADSAGMREIIGTIIADGWKRDDSAFVVKEIPTSAANEPAGNRFVEIAIDQNSDRILEIIGRLEDEFSLEKIKANAQGDRQMPKAYGPPRKKHW
jgi:hypothetical protein